MLADIRVVPRVLQKAGGRNVVGRRGTEGRRIEVHWGGDSSSLGPGIRTVE